MTTPGAGFQLEEATVAYNGHLALDRVSLRIAPGEVVAFVGPSGAGKTTLLRLLNGAVRPTQGKVAVDGQALASIGSKGLRAVRSRVGFVNQQLNLVPNLRVSQNVLAGRLGKQSFLSSVKSMLRASHEELLKVHELLERVGIREKLFQRTDELSGGQQQRVAIARALYQEPSALLADEPVASLDPTRGQDVLELLVTIARERSITTVMSLHDLVLARLVMPRLIGLREGQIMFDRPTEQVTDEEFQELYRLEAGEMLRDGA